MPGKRSLPRPLSLPHPTRLALDSPDRAEILRRHDLAMMLDQPGYLDPATGHFVFTAKKLAELERCCAMACRHCPYKR